MESSNKLSPAEIGEAGEKHVARDLQRKGYKIVDWDTRGPGKTDIKASKDNETYLYQVKTAIGPSLPAALSPEEEGAIKARAIKLGARAYEAQVMVDTNLRLVGEIKYRALK